MALRMTRRDTYGGECGWQDGAGVSWTSPGGGGRQQWRDREPLVPQERAEQRWDERTNEHPGLLQTLAGKLGFRKPGPKGYQRSDERIREDICERLWDEPQIDASDVSVEVKDAVVLLEGTVPHRPMKYIIEEIAADASCVKDVENRIRVARGL